MNLFTQCTLQVFKNDKNQFINVHHLGAFLLDVHHQDLP